MKKSHANQNIILTGFMGTGKTTVGRLLAETLSYQLIDTDVWITERTGRTIPQIFAQDGEAGFRALEREAAAALAQRTGLVIATGGRMMLDPHNARVLGKTGLVFCLVATPKEILSRVTEDPKGIERPLLQVPNPLQRITDLLNERRPLYERFPQIITSGKTIQQVVQEILFALE
ncbi:MAG: shikimate kinase [Ardenticatenaceae bacterium]|nr:shikimate kinase [Ardenticatenaceae bacterium]